MSNNFWADKLRPGAPRRHSEPVTTTHQPATNRPWWDTTHEIAPPPVDQAPQPYQPQYDQPPAPTKAQHARQTDRCPECGGGNYFTPMNNQRHGPRCYECGYPKLHSTSGVMASNDGDVRAARQHHGGESHYHPEIIVNRVS